MWLNMRIVTPGQMATIPLGSLTTMGEECVHFSNDTAMAFHGVILLLDEILESVQAGRGVVEGQAAAAESEMLSTAAFKAELEKQMEENRKREIAAEDQVHCNLRFKFLWIPKIWNFPCFLNYGICLWALTEFVRFYRMEDNHNTCDV